MIQPQKLLPVLPNRTSHTFWTKAGDSITVTREQFLESVWGYNAYPTTRTVDNQFLSLRAKLEPDPSRPRHLLTVHGVGYRLEQK